MPIEADMDEEGIQVAAAMQQTKARVLNIEVKVQALAPFQARSSILVW